VRMNGVAGVARYRMIIRINSQALSQSMDSNHELDTILKSHNLLILQSH
jgi:hypothetical protein